MELFACGGNVRYPFGLHLINDAIVVESVFELGHGDFRTDVLTFVLMHIDPVDVLCCTTAEMSGLTDDVCSFQRGIQNL